MNLDDLMNEFLDIEVKQEVRPTFGDRIHDFLRRKDIEKRLEDERKFIAEKIVKEGNDSLQFLKSSYYKDLIEPHIKLTIKSGIQTLLRESDNMTESQMKVEIQKIRSSINMISLLKLKIYQAKEARNDLQN